MRILGFLLLALVQPVFAQGLFNNAVKGGLTGEGLITGNRPEGGYYSEVQLGNGSTGTSFRRTSFWLADDFEVVGARWRIRKITVWGYQNDLHYPSIDQGFAEIRRSSYDGPTIAVGNWARSDMTDIYRIFNNQPDGSRQCQRITFHIDALLGPGKYWVVFGALGVVNVNGPWSPHLTPIGELTVPGANAMCRIGTGTTIYWKPIEDAGSFAPKDLPLWIDGEKLPLAAPRGQRVEPPSPVPDPVRFLLSGAVTC